MISRIKISPKDLQIIKEEHKAGNKIKAIKHARAHGRVFPPAISAGTDSDGVSIEVANHRVGLRDAKEAVEVLAGTRSRDQAEAIFAPSLRIKKVIVEGQHGDLELDLDELQLKILEGLSAPAVSLTELSDLTNLMVFIRDWQDGNGSK